MRGGNWKALFFSGLLTLSMQTALGAEKMVNDFQNWDVITLTLPVSPGKRVLFYGEAQPRVGNLQDRGTSNDFSMLILRTALGYQLTPKISVWQGYAWVPIFEPEHLNENRIFQQIQIKNKFHKLDIVNRTRLEERWIENTEKTSIRARHLLRLTYPLDRKERWLLVGSNEVFVTLKGVPNGPANGFDQNRLFVGINRKLNKNISLETGYMNQYVNTRDPLSDRMNHIIWLGVNFQGRQGQAKF